MIYALSIKSQNIIFIKFICYYQYYLYPTAMSGTDRYNKPSRPANTVLLLAKSTVEVYLSVPQSLGEKVPKMPSRKFNAIPVIQPSKLLKNWDEKRTVRYSLLLVGDT